MSYGNKVFCCGVTLALVFLLATVAPANDAIDLVRFEPYVKQDGSAYVKGKITNYRHNPVQSVKVHFKVYNSAGSVVDTCFVRLYAVLGELEDWEFDQLCTLKSDAVKVVVDSIDADNVRQ